MAGGEVVMTEAEEAAPRRRIEELEKVIAEYAEWYGLSDAARKAMVERRGDQGRTTD